MDSIIKNLVYLKDNLSSTYKSSDLWINILTNPPYSNFLKAFEEKNIDNMKKILLNYKENYHTEFSQVNLINVNLLNLYNKEFNTNLTLESSEISNISNFGIQNTDKCYNSPDGIVINTLSIRYYFTYLFLNKFLENKNNVNILEIGCCSPVGIMQNFLKYSFDKINCILLCDLFEVLLISYSTVLFNFPDLKILFYNNEKNIDDLLKNYDVIFIIPDYIDNFINCKIEFCFNSYSFSEMSEENLKHYFDFLTKTTKYVISENKHYETDNNSVKALLKYIPNNLIKYSEHKNINVPDGKHNIICFKNNLYE